MKHIYKLLFVFAIMMAIISTAVAVTEDQPDIMVNPADNNFLNITGIAGESKDVVHKDEIDILSWSFGAAMSGSLGGGSGAAKPSFNDFTIIKEFDKSSPKLFLAEVSGQQIPKMILTVRKPGANQHEFLKITFENVMVTKFETSETENGVIDQWSFKYNKIQIVYQEQRADGSPGDTTTAGWDIKLNKPIIPI